MARLVALWVLAGLLLVGCQAPEAVRQCPYEAMARAEIIKTYPDYDAARPMALIDLASDEARQLDLGRGRKNPRGLMVLYFPQPEGRIGGSPTVEIRKVSCRVERIYRTQ